MSITKSTIVVYEYSGSTNELTIPFDYLKREFVVVSLSGKGKPQKALKLGTDYRFATKTTIIITRQYQPDEGFDKVVVRRVTDASKRIINYQDGSILNASELNISQLQSLHVAEEARDLANYTLFVDDENNLDARGRRIINVGDPINPQDAVTKKYVDTASESVIDSRNKALQYRNEAEEFKNQAQGFRNEAETFKNTAEQKASEISSKIEKADALNTQAITNSNKAQQYATSAQQSASAASQAEKNAQASDKSASKSAEEAKRYAASVNPELLVHKASLIQTTGNSPTEVMSQKAVTLSVGSRLTVNTIEDLKALSLEVGTVVNVLGYHAKNDGSEHLRIIEESDDGSGVSIANGKFANCRLAVETFGYIDFRWLGAKSDFDFSTKTGTDNSAVMVKCIDYANKRCSTDIMVIGNFYLGTPITTRGQLSLKGRTNPSKQLISNATEYSSIVKPMSSLHIKKGITAFTLLGTGGAKPTDPKDTHFYIRDLYLDVTAPLGGAKTTFLVCKAFGAPSRPCYCKSVEATNFYALFNFDFDESSSKSGTNTYNFSMDDSCKFYNNDYAIMSRGRDGYSPSIGGLMVANSVSEMYSKFKLLNLFGCNTLLNNLLEGQLDSFNVSLQSNVSSFVLNGNYFEANTGTWFFKRGSLNFQNNYYSRCTFKTTFSACALKRLDMPLENVKVLDSCILSREVADSYKALTLDKFDNGSVNDTVIESRDGTEYAREYGLGNANFKLQPKASARGVPLVSLNKERLSVIHNVGYQKISAVKGDYIILAMYKTKGYIDISFVRDSGGVDSGLGALNTALDEGLHLFIFKNKTQSPITTCTIMGKVASANPDLDVKVSSASVYVVKESEWTTKKLSDVMGFPLIKDPASPASLLNTPYYATKMQREGVYEDFIEYMDSCKAMETNRDYEVLIEEDFYVVEEPKPSEALQKFIDDNL